MAEYHLNLIYNPSLPECYELGRFEPYSYSPNDALRRSRQWVMSNDGTRYGATGDEDKDGFEISSKDQDDKNNMITVALGVRTTDPNIEVGVVEGTVIVCRKAVEQNSTKMRSSPFYDSNNRLITHFYNSYAAGSFTHNWGDIVWYEFPLGCPQHRPLSVPATDPRRFEIAFAAIINLKINGENNTYHVSHDPEMQVRD